MTKKDGESSRQPHDPDLNRKILEYIAANPGCDRKSLVDAMDKPQTTVRDHINALRKDGDIFHGLSLTESGKKKHIKVYIFVYTAFRPRHSSRISGENYQQKLVDEIRVELATEKYRNNLFVDSVDIVMGGDFDVVLSLRADHLEFIGSFVTSFLRSHNYVYKTRTTLAWPISPTSIHLPPQSETQDVKS